MILVERQSEYWVYGTPWTGESGHFSSAGVPLGGLFFIRHAPQNVTTPVVGASAVEQLLARSYLVPYDATAVRNGLESRF